MHEHLIQGDEDEDERRNKVPQISPIFAPLILGTGYVRTRDSRADADAHAVAAVLRPALKGVGLLAQQSIETNTDDEEQDLEIQLRLAASQGKAQNARVTSLPTASDQRVEAATDADAADTRDTASVADTNACDKSFPDMRLKCHGLPECRSEATDAVATSSDVTTMGAEEPPAPSTTRAMRGHMRQLLPTCNKCVADGVAQGACHSCTSKRAATGATTATGTKRRRTQTSPKR